MNNKLYIGNLSYNVTSDGLRDMFASYGEITEARVITFKDTGRSRGFGFVEFAKEEDAKKAVDEMNQKEVEGRKLVVNIARPMEQRDNRSGGGYNSNRGGGYNSNRGGGYNSNRGGGYDNNRNSGGYSEN